MRVKRYIFESGRHRLGCSAEPVQTFVQSVAVSSAGGLDVPLLVLQLGQFESFRDFRHRLGLRQVLLVGVDQKTCVLQLLVVDESPQFLLGQAEAFVVAGVNHKDDALSVVVIVSPQVANSRLASDVPDVEVDVLVADFLDIEAHCRNG